MDEKLVEGVAVDTLPKLLLQRYRQYGDKKIAMRKKLLGVWKGYTFKDSFEHTERVSLGLIALGLKPGDKVGMVGDNDPEYFWGEWAVQAAGGIEFGLYADAHYEEAKYILSHGDASFIFAKDQEQVDKILSIKGDLPLLKKVIYWEEKGIFGYDDPLLISFKELEALGEKYKEEHPDLFVKNILSGKGEDIAIFSFTSGTTGARPKAVMISHKGMIKNAELYNVFDKWTPKDRFLSYMPMAWIADQFCGMTSGLISGAEIYFPEEPETVQENMQEVAPQVVMFSARLWENMVSTIQAKIEETTLPKRFLFRLFLPVGYKVQEYIYSKKPVPFFWKALMFLGRWMVFRPLLGRIGMSGVRVAYQGGAPLSPDCLKFLRATGLDLRQAYGGTEVGVVSFHAKDNVDPESVGALVIPKEDIKISEEGEILVRGEALFVGYYKMPEETEKALKDGWFHPGDAGYITPEGHIIYLGRVSELRDLKGGGKFPAEFIEGKVKFSPYIKDCMAVGGGERDFVAAIVIIDYDNAGKWAERHRIPYTTFADLSQKPEIYALVRKHLEGVNRLLPEYSRVKRFVNLNKEFDPDEGELTRSRKLRRNVVEEKFKALIDVIYSGQEECELEATVKYRDGRTGTIKSILKPTAVEK